MHILKKVKRHASGAALEDIVRHRLQANSNTPPLAKPSSSPGLGPGPRNVQVPRPSAPSYPAREAAPFAGGELTRTGASTSRLTSHLADTPQAFHVRW